MKLTFLIVCILVFVGIGSSVETRVKRVSSSGFWRFEVIEFRIIFLWTRSTSTEEAINSRRGMVIPDLSRHVLAPWKQTFPFWSRFCNVFLPASEITVSKVPHTANRLIPNQTFLSRGFVSTPDQYSGGFRNPAAPSFRGRRSLLPLIRRPASW